MSEKQALVRTKTNRLFCKCSHFPLSKNLAHNSPRTEINNRKESHYEEVFGFHDHAVDASRHAAAFGRGMPASSSPSRSSGAAISDDNLCNAQLCCTPSELLSTSSQHGQYRGRDRSRRINGRADRRSSGCRARHAHRARRGCALHLQAKSEETSLLRSTSSKMEWPRKIRSPRPFCIWLDAESVRSSTKWYGSSSCHMGPPAISPVIITV